MALGLVIMALFVKRFRRIFIFILLVVAIIAGVYWAVIVSSRVVEQRLKAEGPIEYRLETWEVALRMLRSHPVFGVGYENFGVLYKQYAYWDQNAPVVPYPHNTYLWILLMGGIVAFIPFFSFLLYTAIVALRRVVAPPEPTAGEQATLSALTASRAELAGVFLASMAGVFAPALAGDIFYCYYSMLVVFFILGAFMSTVVGSSEGGSARAVGELPPRLGDDTLAEWRWPR
jgi:O-antigen ligase